MLSAIFSTTNYMNPSQFTRTNFTFQPKAGLYTGPGYNSNKKPVYPLRKLTGWVTNTSLELANIVYPDGTPRNASAAQAKVAEDLEKQQAAVKIQNLQKQAGAAPNAAARAEILGEIEKLQHKYFPSEITVNELRANGAGINQINVSAGAHAQMAEQQRLAIINELRALSSRGIVSQSPPMSPPPSFAAAAGLPTVSPAMATSGSPPTALSPPASSAGTAAIPSNLNYSQEEKTLENIEMDLSSLGVSLPVKPANTAELINLISFQSDPEIRKQYVQAAALQLDNIAPNAKNDAVVYYLYQLALLQAGLDPSEYSNLKIDKRISKYGKIVDQVKKYKNSSRR